MKAIIIFGGLGIVTILMLALAFGGSPTNLPYEKTYTGDSRIILQDDIENGIFVYVEPTIEYDNYTYLDGTNILVQNPTENIIYPNGSMAIKTSIMIDNKNLIDFGRCSINNPKFKKQVFKNWDVTWTNLQAPKINLTIKYNTPWTDNQFNMSVTCGNNIYQIE